MSKLSILIKHVYLQKIRVKTFILTTLLYLAVIAVILNWSSIKSIFVNDEMLEIAILNETPVTLDDIFISNDDINFINTKEEQPALFEQLEDEKLDAVITVAEENGSLKADIATYTPLTFNDQMLISSYLENAAKIYGIQQLNLSAAEAEKILSAAPIITTTNLNEALEGGKSEDEKESGIWISYFVGIVIYFFIFSFLTMITTDVASEKGSRALEMLLVSVKPGTHFQSKIIGIFLLAITQFVVIFGFAGILLSIVDNGSKWEIVQSVIDDLSWSYVVYVIGFLLFTILLYLIIGALFGSLVSKVEEASQVMTPAILVTVIGFYIMIMGVANADTILIKVFSYIPVTSGMVMPLRIGATDISVIEPILSLSILIGTVILAYVFSLIFYKRSVLTYSTGGIIQKIKTVLKVTT